MIHTPIVVIDHEHNRLLTVTNRHHSFIVVGDIHGNLDDFIRIFERHRYPPDQFYLFLDDIPSKFDC
jgi:hypothetical protein